LAGNEVIKDAWVKSLKKHCADKYDRNSFFLMGSVKGIGYFICGYAAYSSLLLQVALFKGQSLVKPPVERACLKQAAVYLVLFGLSCVPLAVIFGWKVRNVWMNLFVKKSLMITIMVLVVGGCLDRLCQACNLYDTVTENEEQDSQKEPKQD